MRVDDVREVDAAVQQLVDLEVGVVVGRADLVAVVGLGEEARGAQDHDRQAVVAVDELAQVLGGGLGHAVDVARHRHDVLGDPRRGRAGRRRQRAAERARRAREHEARRPRPRPPPRAASSVPVTLVSTNAWRACEPTCGLCSVAACSDGVDARASRARTQLAVGDRADDARLGRRQDVEPDDLVALGRAARARAPRRGGRSCR